MSGDTAVALALLLVGGICLGIGVAIPEVRGRWREAAGRLSIWGPR